MADKKYHTFVDLKDCFYQFPCTDRMSEYYAFSAPGIGNFAVSVINEILYVHKDDAKSFFDDISISSIEWDEHLTHVEGVLTTFDERRVKLAFDKIKGAYTHTHFDHLGFEFKDNKYSPKWEIREKLSQCRSLRKTTFGNALDSLTFPRSFGLSKVRLRRAFCESCYWTQWRSYKAKRL